jgi:sensory rhodopsin
MMPCIPLLAADALSMAFNLETPLMSLTLYTFAAATVAMGAGAAYFTLMLVRGDLDAENFTAVTVTALICGIACVNYHWMNQVYQASGGDFPTALRYVDWVLTTPLLLLLFPLLLGLWQESKWVFGTLLGLDVAMIGLGFAAEVMLNSGLPWSQWAPFFLLSCGCEVAILAILFGSLSQTIDDAPTELAAALRVMRLFVLIGWAIYPVGFLLALGGGGDVRELIYNVADVVNKVGFGLVVHGGISAATSGMGWGRR